MTSPATGSWPGCQYQTFILSCEGALSSVENRWLPHDTHIIIAPMVYLAFGDRYLNLAKLISTVAPRVHRC